MENTTKLLTTRYNSSVTSRNAFGVPSKSLAPFSGKTFHNNLNFDKMQTSPANHKRSTKQHFGSNRSPSIPKVSYLPLLQENLPSLDQPHNIDLDILKHNRDRVILSPTFEPLESSRSVSKSSKKAF